jgi:hypothetical protein
MNATTPRSQYQGKTLDDAIQFYARQDFTLIARRDDSVELGRAASFNKWVAFGSFFAFGIGLLAYLGFFLLFLRDRVVTISFDAGELVTNIKRRTAPISLARMISGTALVAVVSVTILGFAARTYLNGTIGTGAHICTSSQYNWYLSACLSDDHTLSRAQLASANLYIKSPLFHPTLMNTAEVGIDRVESHASRTDAIGASLKALGTAYVGTPDLSTGTQMRVPLVTVLSQLGDAIVPGTYYLDTQAGLYESQLTSFGTYKLTITP